MMGLPDRLAQKIQLDPATGCWVWIAAKDGHGYGRVRWDGKVRFSHRVVFTMLKGDPCALDLDHLCRNPSCVNPDHLEPVPHDENVRRGVSGEAHRVKYANHLWCPKGHPLFGDNLYARRNKAGYINKQCRTCRRARWAEDNKRRAIKRRAVPSDA